MERVPGLILGGTFPKRAGAMAVVCMYHRHIVLSNPERKGLKAVGVEGG